MELLFTSCLFFGCYEKINKHAKLKLTLNKKLCRLAVLSGFGLTLTLAIAFMPSTDICDWQQCSGRIAGTAERLVLLHFF